MTKREYVLSVAEKCRKKTINKKFGLLRVKEFHHRDATHTYWVCECDCGKKIITNKNSLVRGSTKSCGCKRKKEFLKMATSHGLSKLPVYKIWHAMMQRCYNSNCKAYPNYGARGIDVEKDWLNFEKWYQDFGSKRPSNKFTIERIDNNKGYSRNNCKWASLLEQQQNKRGVTRLTYKNEQMSIKSWARKFDIPKTTAYYRLSHGWSFEECFLMKKRKTIKDTL